MTNKRSISFLKLFKLILKEIRSLKDNKDNLLDMKYIDEKLNIYNENINSNLNEALFEINYKLQAVQKLVEEKEKKIREYEDGYFYKNKSNFIKEIIRIIDESKSNPDLPVEEFIEDLEILLENENIEKIELEVGDSYIGNELQAKIKKTISTDDEEKDKTIAEIVKTGYRLFVGNDYKILKPVEVIIYKFNKE